MSVKINYVHFYFIIICRQSLLCCHMQKIGKNGHTKNGVVSNALFV